VSLIFLAARENNGCEAKCNFFGHSYTIHQPSQSTGTMMALKSVADEGPGILPRFFDYKTESEFGTRKVETVTIAYLRQIFLSTNCVI
jgi:hypothetical protein